MDKERMFNDCRKRDWLELIYWLKKKKPNARKEIVSFIESNIDKLPNVNLIILKNCFTWRKPQLKKLGIYEPQYLEQAIKPLLKWMKQ